MKSVFFEKIQSNPVIATVNCAATIEEALDSPCEIIFLMKADIFTIKDTVHRIKDKGKGSYVHMDLLEGFSRDETALRYIHEHVQPDGIITTKTNLIKIAKKLGVFAIQRLFILDSMSLDTGIKGINDIRPDAIEIMPGIMPKIIKRIHEEVRIPVIAGGLIQDKEDVIQCLRAGAVGISTSSRLVWYL